MFKKITLALTFLAAFSVASFTMAPQANAWRYYGRPYVNYYYGPPRAYNYGYGYYPAYRTYNPYRSYYNGPVYNGPVARPYYNAYYGPGYYGGVILR